MTACGIGLLHLLVLHNFARLLGCSHDELAGSLVRLRNMNARSGKEHCIKLLDKLYAPIEGRVRQDEYSSFAGEIATIWKHGILCAVAQEGFTYVSKLGNAHDAPHISARLFVDSCRVPHVSSMKGFRVTCETPAGV